MVSSKKDLDPLADLKPDFDKLEELAKSQIDDTVMQRGTMQSLAPRPSLQASAAPKQDANISKASAQPQDNSKGSGEMEEEKKRSGSASVVAKLTELADKNLDADGKKILSDEVIKNLYDHEDLNQLQVVEDNEYSLNNLQGPQGKEAN